MKRITLHKGKEKSLLRYHPWVFSGAVAKMDKDIGNGEIVEVCDHSGAFLALGHYHDPGFGGQQFIERTYEKIRQLRLMIEKQHASAIIEVDGGVNTQNAKALFEAGANVLVAGNAVFKFENPLETISQLKH